LLTTPLLLLYYHYTTSTTTGIADCSSHGNCRHYQADGKTLKTEDCLEHENCLARCECDFGWSGGDCSSSSSDIIILQDLKLTLLSQYNTLYNTLPHYSTTPSYSTVQEKITVLRAITLKVDEMRYVNAISGQNKNL